MALPINCSEVFLNTNAPNPIKLDVYSEISKKIWECVRYVLKIISCGYWKFDAFLEISLIDKTVVYILPDQIKAGYRTQGINLPAADISQANLSLFIQSAKNVELAQKELTYQQQLQSNVSSFPIDITLFEPQSDKDRQIIIGKVLQSMVLPFYKNPMPRQASRKDPKSGLNVLLTIENEATYQNHLKNIQNKKTTARQIHGAMHAVRVALWTQVLLRFYEKLGREKLQDPILLASAGGMHDVARENEHRDYWDEESSEILHALLTRANIDSLKIERYVQTIREKDPKNGVFFTDEQRIVHDADCLDIMRSVNKDNFIKDFLCFYKFNQDKKELNNQLIDQVCGFIQLTEKPELAKYLEHNSDDYYGDIVRILFAKQGEFPLLCELIAQDMHEILSTQTDTSNHALRVCLQS